ncbi:hypothetical protein ACFO3J_16495 [Streptomyces polygonati]|uniref:GAF domain-containing protein n=1 Tax=Streptomyces polygonati TaxID=1617087 RepID=A0ABV8HS02_9ACTN
MLNVLAYAAAAMAGEYELGWVFWVVMTIGAGATLTLIFMSARGALVGKRLVDAAAASQRNLLQEMLVPIIEVLGAITVTTAIQERKELKKQMTHVVITAARLVGPAASRVCFLELEGAAGSRVLKCRPGMWIGRQETPQTKFEEGTQRGDRLLGHMDSRRPLFVADLTSEAPALQPDSNTYKTFIAAAVAPSINHEAYGILAIDAMAPGDLQEGDKKIIEVLGQLLGSALAM